MVDSPRWWPLLILQRSKNGNVLGVVEGSAKKTSIFFGGVSSCLIG